MKNLCTQFTSAIIIILLLVGTSCKKNDDQQEESMFMLDQGYQKEEAAVIMTLAAIAYTAEGFSTQIIKDSINIHLGKQELATKGEWELAWGPGVNNINSNLVYLAKNNSVQPPAWAMAVRGTSTKSIEDILQDIQVFKLEAFTYGLAGDSIARGSMDGLEILLGTQDPVSGKTLEEFLPTITLDEKAKMYVTGHSQGGALAPLLAYWFISSSGVADKFKLETYAFAGPSVGNQSFKTNFHNSQPSGSYFNMVANPIDVVPYFWARFDSLVPNKIPAEVPLAYRILITAAEDELKNKNIHYVQLDDQIDIGSYPPTDTLGHIHPHETMKWYNYWMLKEHTHNSYLELLDAKPI